MALRDWFSAAKIPPEKRFYIGTPTKDESTINKVLRDAIQEQLRGEVQKNPKQFLQEIGEDHPFDYMIADELYLQHGFVSGAVDKLVDFVWGPGFHTKSEDGRAKKIIDTWLREVNFDHMGRRWFRDALRSSGFLELGGSETEAPQGIKVLNPRNMYVSRDDKGRVMNYTQYTGTNARIIDKNRIIKFKPFEIAHLPLNLVGDSPYGYGVIYPCLRIITNILNAEQDMHILLKRKANVPIVAKLGTPGSEDQPTNESLAAFASAIQQQSNKTEWVVSSDVDMGVLDFGKVTEKFEFALQHDLDMFFFGIQMPEVLMGRGSIPEGLATTQLEVVDRRVKSYQEEIEKVIENDIFKRILRANNIDAHVDFEWGQPSKSELNARVAQIGVLLQNAMLHPKLRGRLEAELGTLFGMDPAELKSMEEERRDEESQPQPTVPGQNSKEEFIEGYLER